MYALYRIPIEVVPFVDVDEEAAGAQAIPLHLSVVRLRKYRVRDRVDRSAGEVNFYKGYPHTMPDGERVVGSRRASVLLDLEPVSMGQEGVEVLANCAKGLIPLVNRLRYLAKSLNVSSAAISFSNFAQWLAAYSGSLGRRHLSRSASRMAMLTLDPGLRWPPPVRCQSEDSRGRL